MSRFLSIVILLIGLGLPQLGFAASHEPASRSPNFVRSAGKATIRGRWVSREGATYVVTHGMGGTRSGDRFERLASELEKAYPGANVLRVDWTPAATLQAFGLPSPWKVAAEIDGVALELAQQLQEAGVDRTKLTMIGESFGNWVNAKAAEKLEGVHCLLAFNPASELAGYALPDLREWSDVAWSFHTRSCYDTVQPIADRGLFLSTRPKATATVQHTSGIHWLADRIAAGDSRWLRCEMKLPTADANHFDAVAGLEGELIAEQPMRVEEKG